MNSQYLIEKFIYSCSHDLRAPVSSIQGLVRIAEYYPHDVETHKCLEMIEACTHKMDKLLSTLQEYMVNSQRPLMVEQLDPQEIIQGIRSEFKNQLDACKIDLVSDVPSSTVWDIDKYSTLRILKHLVSNSISFHDSQKKERKIIIHLDSNESGYKLKVSDNGKGIPEDQQKRIFDVFFRGSENSIGVGMGLFLAKSLADKMGGSMSCESKSEEGTTITASFPKVPSQSKL